MDDPKTEADNAPNGFQQEEDRMRAQREKQDAKREAQLEKERQADIKSGKVSGNDVVGSMIAISKVAEEQMGGTSGAIYS